MVIEKEAAGVKSRKHIDKSLSKAKANHAVAKKDYEKFNKELQSAQARVDDAKKRLQEARAIIESDSNDVRIMDLTGANARKQRGEDVCYVVDGADYVVDANDINDIKMTPYKLHKKNKGEAAPVEEPKEEEEDCMDVEDEAEADSGSLAAILRQLGHRPAQEQSSQLSMPKETYAAPGFLDTLETLKNLEKMASSDDNAKWEYFAAKAEIKDMASGLRRNLPAEFESWKDQDFKDLLNELS